MARFWQSMVEGYAQQLRLSFVVHRIEVGCDVGRRRDELHE